VSIETRTGDGGSTALMYGRRVPKSHLRVEAYGAVDELNAALGMARAVAEHDFIRKNLFAIQKDLVVLMGELSVHSDDLPRYLKDGYSPVTPAMTARLDALVQEIETQNVSPKGWAMPGATKESAALDVSRTVCRRAERRVCAVQESGELANSAMVAYLNRLGDLLWLFARWVEARVGVAVTRPGKAVSRVVGSSTGVRPAALPAKSPLKTGRP
jgi:cob(I)alamin adenosyltransferase